MKRKKTQTETPNCLTKIKEHCPRLLHSEHIHAPFKCWSSHNLPSSLSLSHMLIRKLKRHLLKAFMLLEGSFWFFHLKKQLLHQLPLIRIKFVMERRHSVVFSSLFFTADISQEFNQNADQNLQSFSVIKLILALQPSDTISERHRARDFK